MIEIPLDAQIEALANRDAYSLLKAFNINAIDIKPYFHVTRRDLIEYLRKHPNLARSYLLALPAQRPYHDQLVIEQRGAKFVVFNMDHGCPRFEHEYTDIGEATADFLAWSYAYGFKDEV